MIVEYVASFIVVLTVTAILYFKWTFNYWRKRNVYTLPTTIPFGNANKVFSGKRSFAFDFFEFHKHLKLKGLPYGGYYFCTRRFFVPVDLKMIHNILIKDFQYFTDHLFYTNEKLDPLTGHLFAQRGAKWKALRTKLTPTFSSGKLKMMFQTLVACTTDLPNVLDQAIETCEPIDIKEILARYTTDVIGSCAFGVECNCLKNPETEFRKFGKKIFEINLSMALKRLATMIIPGLLPALRVPVEDKSVEKFFINLVKETIELRDKNSVKRNDFMQLLLDLRHTTIKVESKSSENQIDEQYDFYQNGLSLNEIVAQVFVFFIAGFETSSTTLTFLMYELAVNLEIQEKLRKEVRDVLTKHDGKITYDGLNKMVYLDKCIYETLRKYPPVDALPRVCTKDYRVPESELIIEKDTPVMISVYAVHHDPEYYPEPEKFDPERFSEENRHTCRPCTYLPFGEGPRICIGLRFAILQMKVGLIALLRNHKFRLNPKTKTPLTFEIKQPMLTAEGGVWVDAERTDLL